ncbi:helix-turn-helix transcriptional regulator [Sphingorhabdus sp. Alg239-R122]|uniref:helix-turn-helix domain-containing protein n=1 Tax=Sphingorhabdus sp. Alg239-R122 TaxID=2305989 RepID=UPI0013D9FFDD|nr:helix-turn-helix transcriptional regulator [Sphingorhabdus sp. Alg239-R122]
MPMADKAIYDSAAPTHCLGQYQAWETERISPAMDMVWISEAHHVSPQPHRVLPHGEPSVAILRTHGSDGHISGTRLVICRGSNTAHWYIPQPREELIAARLKPEYSARICGFSPTDICHDMPNVLDIAYDMRVHFSASLKAAEASHVHDVAAALASDIRQFSRNMSFAETPENAALDILRRCGGRIRTRAIARTLEISERHLRRRFSCAFGQSPKSYARHLRVTGTALHADKLESPDWAQLAYASGFHDQAHMINEFKALIGLTPQSLYKERRALAVFCNNSRPAAD